MSWNDAQAVAMIAATQAQNALRVPRGDYVEVFAALRRARVEVIGQPLGSLLGLYVAAPDGGPGCLVNCGLEEVAMRHTLAHELGHHWLGHGTTVDHEEQSSSRWGQGWPQHEKEAEAFASWFLMPLPAAQTALRRCGLQRPQNPVDVYRVARWLGAPYATTVRHLVRLKLISRSSESVWLRDSPGVLKADLAKGVQLSSESHVHLLGPGAHRATVHAAAGDLLLLDIPGARWDPAPAGVSETSPADREQLSLLDPGTSAAQGLWVTEGLTDPVVLTAATPQAETFCVTVHRTPPRLGSDEFWT